MYGLHLKQTKLNIDIMNQGIHGMKLKQEIQTETGVQRKVFDFSAYSRQSLEAKVPIPDALTVSKTDLSKTVHCSTEKQKRK